jgi:hypothetical protein
VPISLEYVGTPGLFPSNVTAEVDFNDGNTQNITLYPNQLNYTLPHTFVEGVYNVSIRIFNKVSTRTWLLTMGGTALTNVKKKEKYLSHFTNLYSLRVFP